MAKKDVAAVVKIQIPAGKATPAPPVGTALGPHGIQIMEFVKQYNAATEAQALSRLARQQPDIVSALENLDLHFPKVDKADRSEFKQVREALLAEEKGEGKVTAA